MILIIERDDLEVFSFIFGAVFGSFLNVLIVRLPKGESIISPRSKCVSCNHTISWYHNIPIVSYFILKGKCAYCGTKISPVYYIVELITGLITLALFVKFGLSLEFLFACLLFYTLITLSFIDFEYKAVPDYLLLIAFTLAFFATSFNILDAFKYAFLFAGAFVLLNFVITFYIQNIKSRILKDKSLEEQEALGEGDIPIVALMGIILGVEAGIVAIFLSAVFAIIPSVYSTISKKDIETPFIPYLSLGFTVEYFFNLSDFLKAVM